MLNNNERYRHKGNPVVRNIHGEMVVIPVVNDLADMNMVLNLNETGSFIWDKIDGKRTVGDIARLVATDYETTEERAEDDVSEFITDISDFLEKV